MNIATLLVAVTSAIISLTTAALSWMWRKDSQFAAITAFRALVARKTVLEPELISWELVNVHGSVTELRDEMARALPTVSRRAAMIGEDAIRTCKDYLLALRAKALAGETRYDSLYEHPELDQRHRAWVTDMRDHLDALDKIRRTPLEPRPPEPDE